MLTVVIVLLALSQRLHTIAAQGYEHESPQYLYMERLRKVTRTIVENDNAGEDAVNPGTLLATSFKDTYPNDGQIGGGGVSYLHFTVPQQSTTAIGEQEESKPIDKSELWLFPRFTDISGDQRWYEITLGFYFTLEGFNKAVEAQVDGILWRGSDECIMVDLTAQTRIIDRKLKKRNLNETLVTVRVTVHHKEEYRGTTTPTEQEWQRTCSSLSDRASNTSFLVVKYFSDEEQNSDGGRKKRTVIYNEPLPAGQGDSSPDGCSLVRYEVNLQEAFGPWVVSPTEPVDVGVCTGSCSSENRKFFTPRSMLKNRLSQSPSPSSVILDDDFKVTCIAVRSSPIKLLINMEVTNSLVLVDYPIKAKTCGCR